MPVCKTRRIHGGPQSREQSCRRPPFSWSRSHPRLPFPKVVPAASAPPRRSLAEARRAAPPRARRPAHRRNRPCPPARLPRRAGGTTGATRWPSQALRLQVVAARASNNRLRQPRWASRLPGAAGRAWRRRGRGVAASPTAKPAAARPSALSTGSGAERSPATAGGGQAPTFGVTRPGRSPRSPPRVAPRRPPLQPWPPCHGSRAVRPQSEATERGPRFPQRGGPPPRSSRDRGPPTVLDSLNRRDLYS